MPSAVQVEIEGEDTQIEWPPDAPIPAIGHQVQIEGETYDVAFVVLTYWTDNQSVTTNVKLKRKPERTGEAKFF